MGPTDIHRQDQAHNRCWTQNSTISRKITKWLLVSSSHIFIFGVDSSSTAFHSSTLAALFASFALAGSSLELFAKRHRVREIGRSYGELKAVCMTTCSLSSRSPSLGATTIVTSTVANILLRLCGFACRWNRRMLVLHSEKIESCFLTATS